MNEILSDTAQINPKFIEKIVQQEIHIPSIDSDRLGTIFSVCTANIIIFAKTPKMFVTIKD